MVRRWVSGPSSTSLSSTGRASAGCKMLGSAIAIADIQSMTYKRSQRKHCRDHSPTLARPNILSTGAHGLHRISRMSSTTRLESRMSGCGRTGRRGKQKRAVGPCKPRHQQRRYSERPLGCTAVSEEFRAGKSTMKVVPSPSAVLNVISPRCWSTIAFTMLFPSP